MVRRNDLDICADILQVARSGAKKTHIVYKANLNFKLVKKYLDRLIEGGLLQASNNSFITTLEGAQFIKRYRTIFSP